MLWSYSTPIEAFKLKTYNLNEFLEDRLSIFLFFDCVFNSWFLYSMSPLTWNLLSLEIINQFSFPRPLSTAEMRGITIKFLQSEKTGIKDNVLAGCKPVSILFSQTGMKESRWLKELHLFGRNNEVIHDHNNHVCNGSFNSKDRNKSWELCLDLCTTNDNFVRADTFLVLCNSTNLCKVSKVCRFILLLWN